MKITFSEPIEIGDLAHRHKLSSLEVRSVSFNLDAGKGKMNACVTLHDKSSSFQECVVLQHSEDLVSFWERVSMLEIDGEPWLAHLLRRCVTAGKIPDGAIQLASLSNDAE